MKKILGIILAVALATPMFAEKETPEQKATKDYSTWLPAAGDFSLGFNLDPLATFAGNLFSGSTSKNTMDKWAGEPIMNDWLPSPLVSIIGTYMLTDQLAAKANIGFGFNAYNGYDYAVDDKAIMLDPLSNEKVIDGIHSRQLSGSIALGVEYRVGKTRPVQGVFGAGAAYAFGERYDRYTYGNEITELNQKPTVSSGMPAYGSTEWIPNARVVSDRTNNMEHMVGIYTSAGVEWFVAPKIALGANVNLDLLFAINPSQSTVYEGWNTKTCQVEKYTKTVAPASNGFHFGTENIGANLYVSFYFK